MGNQQNSIKTKKVISTFSIDTKKEVDDVPI